MDKWTPQIVSSDILQVILGIGITTFIFFVIGFLYFFQSRKLKPDDKPTLVVLFVDTILDMIKKMILLSLGKKYIKFTPYFFMLFMFLAISNISAIIGIREATTSYTVPLTLTLITWVGSQIFAIKYQRLSYLTSFLVGAKIKGRKWYFFINPLEIVSRITPIISLSMRLWGNMFAGYVLYAVFLWAAAGLFPLEVDVVTGDIIHTGFPQIGLVLAGVLILPALYLYFSLFTGLIQAYVFTLLSTSYWGQEIEKGREILEAKKINIEENQKNENIIS